MGSENETYSFNLTIPATIYSTGVEPSSRWGYHKSMVSTPRLFRLCSQAIGTYAASPRNPKPVGSLTPPNFVARKMSLRFSGFKASHLPMIISASPYEEGFESAVRHRMISKSCGFLVSHRGRWCPRKCILFHTRDRAGQVVLGRVWEPSSASREIPCPWYRSQFVAPGAHSCPMAAIRARVSSW